MNRPRLQLRFSKGERIDLKSASPPPTNQKETIGPKDLEIGVVPLRLQLQHHSEVSSKRLGRGQLHAPRRIYVNNDVFRM